MVHGLSCPESSPPTPPPPTPSPAGFRCVPVVVSAIPGQLSPGATCKGLPGTARRAPCATWPSTPSTSGAQLSCSQRCGDQSGPCSCHPTCFGLASCCVDIRDFCLEISPYSGSMMGGKDFVVRHLNWSNPGTDSVICRWEAPEGARWGPDPLVGWVGGPRTEGWGCWPDVFPKRRLGASERVGPRRPSLSTLSTPCSFKESIQTHGYASSRCLFREALPGRLLGVDGLL